ncbi:NAD-dependent epimerase/dehydratase family protein [Roseateles violae]|uniref:NAD(P)-dependent oxidoreductase n=1 Tax=Roseateles violae TaxID=3058042 RepID=A0ABT8DXH4_9BURK|nr:NAD(P)-dependent oxidoreductase [Pelomonas sp. PFR6]MDN3921464.1 NAD(P)-dependent oxidoreductase [Pelomonas sp. PFR6]
MSSHRPTVLLTGAAGRLARSIRSSLQSHCAELRLTDRVPVEAPGYPAHCVHLGELADIGEHPQLLEGVDAIVHLAGHPREADWPTLIEANMTATIALWEAARAQGVQRIVYASSNHAVGFYPRSQRIDHEAPTRPDSRYGLTKVFMEGLASLYADKYGLRAFGMRIGHCAPEPSDARMLAHWIHPEDLADLVLVGLHSDYHCELVYGASANSRSWWDNRRAQALGYSPRHSADPFAARLESLGESDPVAERYQGGAFAAQEYQGDPERAARGR